MIKAFILLVLLGACMVLSAPAPASDTDNSLSLSGELTPPGEKKDLETAEWGWGGWGWGGWGGWGGPWGGWGGPWGGWGGWWG